MSFASERAPLDMWTGADSGQVRPALLRAHPLLNDGVIVLDRLGRRLAHVTIEFERPLFDEAAAAGGSAAAPLSDASQMRVLRRSLASVKWAAFADTARVFHGMTGDGRTQVDIGVGLRIHLVGAPAALRFDLARGVRDGRLVASAGWQLGWAEWRE